jgi:3-oxoacyl-[acyl-carrier protein] reductase
LPYLSGLQCIDMALLEGKVALVTGGSRGIGEAIVRRLVQEGAQVAFTYLSSSAKSDALAAELDPTGTRVRAYKSDAGDFAQAEALIKQVIEDFGSMQILVNNAGITRDTLLLRMSEQQWDEVIHVNLKSVFNLTKHAMRSMMRGGGSIINVSSVVGDFGNAGQANYAASKAGIFGFTKSVAKEMGSRNLRCNAIAPGFIETEMTHELTPEVQQAYLKNIPLGRFGKGQEVADVIVFLASDMSSYINGQTISICGGLNT